jgi:arabinogalactan endo-1,4-beta-galactosidase
MGIIEKREMDAKPEQTCGLYWQVITLLVLLLWIFTGRALSQEFYYGHDLSYVNQMEDCGAVFREAGEPRDVYSIFADHGSNLVRVRLWVDPSWWQDSLDQPQGVKPHYNDLEDVKETIERAKNAGMKVMLGIHYSDFWADPGRQLIPRAWLGVAYSLQDLKDSVYLYTKQVLNELDREGLMPEFVKIGNENNSGILRHIPGDEGYEPVASVSDSWSRHAELYNAAIAAVREVGATASVNPRIVLHFSNRLSGQIWNYNNIISHGVTDFDIMGISYYYAWHGASIGELESTLGNMVRSFPGYEVMVVETGYLWTTENFDALGNIITEPDPMYLPVIPEKQLEYLVDFTRAVRRAGGIGVIFWEPAWVSTPCATPWGTGSSHDHVVFFDPVHTNFMEKGGGRWCEPEYYEDLDAVKVTFRIDMNGADDSRGVYLSGSWDDAAGMVPMASEGNGIYSFFIYLPPGSDGVFHFYNDTTTQAMEPVPDPCRDPESGGRTYVIGDSPVTCDVKWASCDSSPPPEEVNVTFRVQMEPSADLSRGVYVVGEITGWEITRLGLEEGLIYSGTLRLSPGEDTLAYYFLTTPTWTDYRDYREHVPAACALRWGSDRGIVVPSKDTIVSLQWGSCLPIDTSATSLIHGLMDEEGYRIYPNPSSGKFYLTVPGDHSDPEIRFYEISGREVAVGITRSGMSPMELDPTDLPGGVYILKICGEAGVITRKVIISRG